ncbi:hypothetical protein D081_1928 [Anaerovibrio sp. JC8]|nr:hypothetical protein D081_1928 [Anaerovibrio sp. JC8]
MTVQKPLLGGFQWNPYSVAVSEFGKFLYSQKSADAVFRES